MKKILIIGSEGFIGSHLTAFYQHKNFDVLRVDVLDKNEANYIQVDKTTPLFHSIFENFQPDVCLNCSGAASVPFSFEQPLNDFKLNVLNVVILLDAIRLHSPNCRFVNFSSAAVYGNPKSIPVRESFDKAPISPYGFHKSIVENIMEEYHQYYKVDCCTLRLFSAYGNGLRKQIMFDLYNKFVHDSQVRLFGTGKETRDYIHIDDICNVVDLVLENSDFDNDVINVANGKEVALAVVVDIYKQKICSNKAVLYSGSVRTGDPTRWQADISKIIEWGYTPTVTLENGIERYVEWIRNA